ncbi:MAG: CBS domain-containing protein [Candidatus Micrarchaeota archaeon]
MELSKAIIVSADEFVSKALAKMKKTGFSALVFDGKKYIGVVDERSMRERRMDATKSKCANIAIKTPVLKSDLEIDEVCRAFFAGRFKTLPVMDGTKVLGTVDRWSVLAAVEKEGFLRGHKVYGHMSSPIMTVNAHSSASVANAIMREANVRRLAVVENGGLVGVVSVFDLLPTREGAEQRNPGMGMDKNSPENFPVYSFMKREIETIDMAASLSNAVHQMIGAKRAALIVVDDKRPVGIITSKDILKATVRSHLKLPVIISGLHGIDKELSEDIMDIGEKLLSKIRGAGAEGLSMHIKGEGNMYFVSAHLLGKTKLRSHASNYELVAAVHEAVDELAAQAASFKVTGISRRRN